MRSRPYGIRAKAFSDPSRQDRRDHLPGDVGQAEVAALELVGQPGVVDPEEAEDRGVEVVDVDDVLDRRVAEFVGRAVGDARP